MDPNQMNFRQLMEIRNRQMIEKIGIPATDDRPMDDTPPSCGLDDLKRPKLRRCPHNISSVIIRGPLNRISTSRSRLFDGGVDGFSYKISFEKGGPAYVMKVLWEPKPNPAHSYFAPQRECQNAALFQMMQAAVSTADAPEPGPILVNPDPKTLEDAAKNLGAFSNEIRTKRVKQLAAGATFPHLVPVTKMPRMRRCHGWMRFRGHELRDRLPRGKLLPETRIDGLRRSIEEEFEYTAIVYEFVEQGANDPNLCRLTLDFLWRAGFQFAPITLEKNWQSSILLDHSEVVHCIGCGWRKQWNLYTDWRRIVANTGPQDSATIRQDNKAQEKDTTTTTRHGP